MLLKYNGEEHTIRHLFDLERIVKKPTPEEIHDLYQQIMRKSPEELNSLFKTYLDIKKFMQLFSLPEQKEKKLAEFVFQPDNLNRLITLFWQSEIKFLLENFQEQKEKLAEYIFQPKNLNVLLRNNTDKDLEFFAHVFNDKIKGLIELDTTYIGSIPHFDRIIKAAFSLNDIETCMDLYYRLGQQEKTYIYSARMAAQSSGYPALEAIFSDLYFGQTVTELDWEYAKKQKYFFDNHVHDGLKLDGGIAKQLTIPQMETDPRKLSILKNNIVIHLIKKRVISIEDALELDQSLIEAYRELHQHDHSLELYDTALLPLLFGRHPVPLDELTRHRENAKLRSPSIQRLIIKGKITVNDVISLSDEDMLTIATREENISSKISPDEGITLVDAIKISLKDSIRCRIDQGKTTLAVGPTTISGHGFSNCIAILVKGQLATGQNAHVFCYFDRQQGYDIICDFKKALSKINLSTCRAILVYNDYSIWVPSALNLLKNANITDISCYIANKNTDKSTHFDISYATNSGVILIKNSGEEWKELVRFDKPQTQENPTALDVRCSPSESSNSSTEACTQSQFFPPVNKKRKAEDNPVMEPANKSSRTLQ